MNAPIAPCPSSEAKNFGLPAWLTARGAVEFERIDFVVLLVARLFGPMTYNMLLVDDIRVLFPQISLEAYQTLGCHWLFNCRVHLSLMSLVAWQFKPCNDRWKKLPLRCLKSKEDWCHLGPEMSAKIQKWWDNEEREDSIKLSTDGMSYYKFVLKDIATQGALLESGGKAACSILLKPVHCCILVIEEVTKVSDDYVRVTFQLGMSGATWFSKIGLAVFNWRMFLTMCSSQLETRLTKPEVKFVRVMRMDGTIVEMAQHPLDENHSIDERHPFARKTCKRPASQTKNAKSPKIENAKKKVKHMDMPLTEGERKKF